MLTNRHLKMCEGGPEVVTITGVEVGGVGMKGQESEILTGLGC